MRSFNQLPPGACFYVLPSREMRFWARVLAPLFPTSVQDDRGLARWVRAVLVTPLAHVCNRTLSFQSYLYDVFHQTALARAAHLLCMPAITVSLFATLSLLMPGAGAWPGGVWFGAFALGVLYLLQAIDGHMPLQALVMLPIAAGSAWAGDRFAAVYRAEVAPTGGTLAWLVHPFTLAVLFAVLQALSHALEPSLPPRITGSDRWIPRLRYMRGSRCIRLVLEGTLYGTLDELLAGPRLLPVVVLHLLWKLGYASDVRRRWQGLSARAIATGNPAVDYIGVGGATPLLWLWDVQAGERNRALAEDDLVRTICDTLDHGDWRPGLVRDDVLVAWSRTLGVPVIGFKTVSEHRGGIDEAVAVLGPGLIAAFGRLNQHDVGGEILRELSPSGPSGSSTYRAIVRTLFDLPIGLAGREFLHEIVVQRLDARTAVVAYQAVTDATLPPVRGFLRCPMAPSGQRITECGDGRVRVEHLMVYELGGRISQAVQDTLFFRGHLNAYADEWRGLGALLDEVGREGHVVAHPRANRLLSGLDMDQLYEDAGVALRLSDGFPVAFDADGICVRSGVLAGGNLRSYRSDVVLPAPCDEIVRLLADEAHRWLGAWNREYRSGETLRTLEVGDAQASWLLRTVYATPWPLFDREYVYVLGRRAESDGSTLIVYLSVADPETPAGCARVRALLHPSVHRCVPQSDGTTLVQHLLTTDLRGVLFPWVQRKLLVHPMVEAHVRDSRAQRALLAERR